MSIEAARSKDVAEQIVLCLQALLEACCCASDEVLPFIERICPILDLAADSVSEEVRMIHKAKSIIVLALMLPKTHCRKQTYLGPSMHFSGSWFLKAILLSYRASSLLDLCAQQWLLSYTHVKLPPRT